MLDTTAGIAAASRLLAAADSVWLGTHCEPDGDAIGSLLGLARLLANAGKVVTAACQDPAPPDVTFLPGTAAVVTHGPAGHDVAVALDSGDLGRLGTVVDAGLWASLPTVVVDHHVSNIGFGDINIVDPRVASTAELVVRLADALGLVPDPGVATCLLTGIVTDTIGFRTPNTTADTLACAQRLMSLGASLPDITQEVFYRRPLSTLRLTGRAVERLQIRGRVALTALALTDFEALGAPLAEGRGISSYLASVQELAAIAVLQERADGTVDVSLRSKPGVDLLPVATALGGGGHPQAAGARVAGSLSTAVATVWATLDGHLSLPE